MHRYRLLFSCTLSVVISCLARVAAADEPKSGMNPTVEMKTSMGTIRIELFADKAPITVKNFLSYVDEKFYDGTLFHRVISTFMIQPKQ